MKALKIISVIVLFSLILCFSSAATENSTVIKKVPEKEKKIALTFDDGPHPYRTAEILDILKENNIKATFFVLGEEVALYPELVRREIEEGHLIGNHTLNHKCLKNASLEDVKYEFDSLFDILESNFGYETSYIRPSGGQYNDSLCKYASENGYKIILWSVDTRDWAHTPVSDIVKNIEENVSDGAIILFHDYVFGKSPTPEALKIIIPKLKNMGYEFVRIDELTN